MFKEIAKHGSTVNEALDSNAVRNTSRQEPCIRSNHSFIPFIDLLCYLLKISFECCHRCLRGSITKQTFRIVPKKFLK